MAARSGIKSGLLRSYSEASRNALVVVKKRLSGYLKAFMSASHATLKSRAKLTRLNKKIFKRIFILDFDG